MEEFIFPAAHIKLINELVAGGPPNSNLFSTSNSSSPNNNKTAATTSAEAVTGIITDTESTGETFVNVKNLKTATGATYPNAQLRAKDIAFIQWTI